jgi:cyclopropane-fatty-acyl-phospholipid synthase
MHARTTPVPHRFSYPVYFYRFDLDELDKLDREVSLFGYNRLRPVSLHNRDYLTPGSEPLKNKLMKLLEQTGHSSGIDRVDLVTSARIMHYVFNPVSFFFCTSAEGLLQCVVVQVNNTFGEMHLYVLSKPLSSRRPGEIHYKAEKVFHVSPFFDRIGSYDFYFSSTYRTDLDIIIQYKEKDSIVFAARLTGKPQKIEKWSVVQSLLKHPLAASMTMPRILWQAAKLRFRKHLPVYHKPPPASPMTIRAAPPGLLGHLGRFIARSLVKKIDKGTLVIHYPEGNREKFGQKGEKYGEIRIMDNAFFRRILFKGDIGLGEAYVAGEWTTGDLPATLILFSENLEHLKEKHHILSFVGRLMDLVQHFSRSNTPAGSRRNISEHYDQGNRFFSLFLDSSMTYSCGIYPRPDSTLEQAQLNKLETIIEKVGIERNHHILEIGCGWGSFAIEAARLTGCRVTGITISAQQLELARERVARAGLQDLITIKLLDYRHLEGQWDGVVSIEMLEAVGHANLGRWFSACSRSLRPGGRALIQVITIPHDRYAYYRRSSDWIRKYIFPGGHLPSVAALERAMRKNSDLLIADVESIGPNYARTLRDWSANLIRNQDEVLAMGFDEAFVRKWKYYFAYCEAGFETGVIDDLQIIMEKPGRDKTG